MHRRPPDGADSICRPTGLGHPHLEPRPN